MGNAAARGPIPLPSASADRPSAFRAFLLPTPGGGGGGGGGGRGAGGGRGGPGGGQRGQPASRLR
ncbi:MAG: hypothetical protein F4Y55_09430 [Gammaproteobacteria bacterium]|nr:hypothetical protein [Gammaproteobacteria bacterium]